ncbi:MAG TPA: hypothetical protein VFM90_03895, partial [Cyclobacteriaceae bacterium]|nr:hypothetical protein [Cyclobacteriaceae bacterium]
HCVNKLISLILGIFNSKPKQDYRTGNAHSLLADKKEMIRKINSIILLVVFATSFAQAQQFGLSFSYFIPKNGYLSTPISPFSIRGVGVNLTDFLAVETGGSLYRMSGLNLKDLPFESKDPLIGPNFTIFVPAELVFMLKAGSVQLDLKGGGFFFYSFDNKLNYGNFDRAIRRHENLEVVNSDLTGKSKPGFGYHAGAELTVYVTGQVGVSFETNYLVGQAGFPVEGSYTGSDAGGTLATGPVDYADAKIDFTGLEFSISLIFDAGGGPAPGKKSRKRRR